MKIFKILSLTLISLLSFSCTEEDNYLSTDPSDTGIFLRTISNKSSAFTPTSYNTSKVDLTLELGGNSAANRLNKVNLYVRYTDSEKVFTGAEKLYKSYSLSDFTMDSGSGLYRRNFVLTVPEIFSSLGITDTSVYDSSDAIRIRYEVEDASGRKYTNTNPGLDLSSAYYASPFVYNFTIVCPYTSSLYSGDYEVVEDSWQDYNPGNIVPVVAGSNANEFKIMSTNNPYVLNTSSYMLVTVTNTTSGTVTVKSNENFDYGASFGSFAVGGSGTVNLCNGDINLTGITFGGAPYRFVLKKK